jgi:competence protein ComEC
MRDAIVALRRLCRLAASIALILLPGVAAAERVSGSLVINVLDVGQGDAVLIVCPKGTHRMLIDTGARSYPGSLKAFQDQLAALMGADRKIDVLIVTHPHDDHVAGVSWVLNTFKVGRFVDSGKPYTPSFAAIELLAKSKARSGELSYFRATKAPAPNIADFCPASNVGARLLIPNQFGADRNVNNSSVVVVVTYDDQRFLFTGDSEDKAEQRLLNDPVTARYLRGAAVYKAGHHGSHTSSTTHFLQVVQPQLAVVSSGCPEVAKNKGYRHPRAATLEALNRIVPKSGAGQRVVRAGLAASGKWDDVRVHDGIYVTSKDGTIRIAADGRRLTTTFPQIHGAPDRCEK